MYQIGYNDALNKSKTNLDNFLSKQSSNKLRNYIELGCSANPNLNLFDLMRKGISNNFDISVFKIKIIKDSKDKIRGILKYYIGESRWEPKKYNNKFNCILEKMNDDAIEGLSNLYDKFETSRKAAGRDYYSPDDWNELSEDNKIFFNLFTKNYKSCPLKSIEKNPIKKVDRFFINIDNDFDDVNFRKCYIKNIPLEGITKLEGFYDKLELSRNATGEKRYTKDMFLEVLGKEILEKFMKFLNKTGEKCGEIK